MQDQSTSREIELLYRITQELLSSKKELQATLTAVLGHMACDGMERGSITIYDRPRNEILIEASHGLSARQHERGRYRPGEGVIGQVVERGEPALIQSIDDEPLFVGCGMMVGVKDGKAVSVAGDPNHPVNDGKLCPKGLCEHLQAVRRARRESASLLRKILRKHRYERDE